jgi:hypothetical protein
MAWEATERIYEKGPIGGPEGKAKSVVLTDESRCADEQAFQESSYRGCRLEASPRASIGPRILE